jgi:pyridoxal 5'-phosphate synthase pdxS subunit
MATTHYNDPAIIAEVSKGLGDPMLGISARTIAEPEQLAVRGW